MEQLIDANIKDVPPGALAAGAAAAMVAGLFYCFLGYRVFRFLLGLTGFVLAGAVAGGLAGWLSHGRLIWMVLGLVIGGAAGAIALCAMYRAGVFFLGFLGALVAAQALLAGRQESWMPLAALAAGVVGGLVALWVERPVMTLATAALGASGLVHGALVLAGVAGLQAVIEDPAHHNAIAIAVLSCWAAMTIAGTATQFATFKPKKESG